MTGVPEEMATSSQPRSETFNPVPIFCIGKYPPRWRCVQRVSQCDCSFIQFISIAPLQVHYYRAYSEALPTQHGCCVGVSRRSATGNCERSTCPRSLRGG